jgi:PPOX class probable F420-dependent enzyme
LLSDSARLLVFIYSQPGRQKLRNISRNPRVDLNLNSNAYGGDIVRVEGRAIIAEVASPAIEVSEYVEKYRGAIARIGFDRAASPGPTL